ncbi:MAG: N-acetylglucosamine-6-phosphate deacetylase [Chloroflexota bacterium]|nr:N-acetylglucosamine-6-phosphate deacetylase [Chloroflexota bacterium]
MNRILIENSRIWQEGGFVTGSTLVLRDGVIEALLPPADLSPQPGDRRIDGRGACAIPGFVDVHLHGSVGFDVMDASPASLEGLADFLLQQGVTSALATTMTDTAERIEAALAVFADRGGAPFRGVHIEGPYLNAAYRGSQPARHLRQPQPEEYLPWLESGLVKLMTIAPEIPAGEDLLRDALSHGAAVSIGHSGASYEAAARYFALGASQVTHTFNGMAGIHHREPGLFIAALEQPRVTFQLIPDGIHVHPAVVRMLLRLVGIERLALITDAMKATGLGDGDYALGDVFVTVKNGEARTPAGGLAGSTLTMGRALKNMMRFCDLTLAEALPMVARVPARSIGMYPQKGSLEIGADADVLLWHEEEGVQATLIGGELVYQAEGAWSAATADG